MGVNRDLPDASDISDCPNCDRAVSCEGMKVTVDMTERTVKVDCECGYEYKQRY